MAFKMDLLPRYCVSRLLWGFGSYGWTCCTGGLDGKGPWHREKRKIRRQEEVGGWAARWLLKNDVEGVCLVVCGGCSSTSPCVLHIGAMQHDGACLTLLQCPAWTGQEMSRDWTLCALEVHFSVTTATQYDADCSWSQAVYNVISAFCLSINRK